MSAEIPSSPQRNILHNWRMRIGGQKILSYRPHSIKIVLSVLMILVGIVAGLLLSSNALLNARIGSERQPVDLTGLIRQEQSRLEERNEQAQELRQEVADLREVAAPVDRDPAQVSATAYASARSAVAGPGIEVQLWDAPIPVEYPPNMEPDDYVVHQQDLEVVINAMWAGGAEAVTVQGHRLAANTAVRCVGNVLIIGGNVYSPPYRVAAIGDPFELEQAIYASERVQTYLWYADAIRLGWSLEPMEEIVAPADERNLSFEYARIPGVDLVEVSS